MDFKLKGRVYYVTGGSRGIGRAIVESLLAEGACVATCARHSEGLDELKSSLNEEQQQRFLSHVGDVLNAEQMEQWIQEVHVHFGRLDGVVANGGSGVSGRVLETPAFIWTEQFNIKVHGVLNVVKPAAEFLKDSDAGRVIIINSVTARHPEPKMAAVSAARAAVLNLSRSLAMALSPFGVCVNTINLGTILTERQRQRYKESGSIDSLEFWSKQEARQRGALIPRMGLPEEVAPAVVFLLSPLASYITSSAVDVAGGMDGDTQCETSVVPPRRL